MNDKNILVSSVNWLGDTIMCMPAVQALRAQYPKAKITIMAKPSLIPLWQLHQVPNNILAINPKIQGAFSTAASVRKKHFTNAFIFPNSFRSALIPFLGRVPNRHGKPGNARSFMLTKLVAPSSASHQSYEYMDILGLERSARPERAKLSIPSEALESMSKKLKTAEKRSVIALIPGAAFGSAKQWPPDYFITAGKTLSQKTGASFAIFGSSSERTLCSQICSNLPNSINLAGETTVSEFAAGLSLCKTAITNDSGGMHIADAAGINVVAIFGMTDPSVTGPLGKEHRIITDGKNGLTRDIKKDDPRAIERMRAVRPEQVIDAALSILASAIK